MPASMLLHWEFLADQLCAGQHVAPLVVAAELHVAAVSLVQVVEVKGLHDHVVELKEAEAPLQSLLVASCAEHLVDAEAGSDVPEELDVVEVSEPVGVVDHHGLAFAEFDKAAHLLLEALTVVVDLLDGHHGAKIRAPGGIADHACAAAYERYGLVACFLQSLHKKKGHKVAYMQGISGRIKADIEGGLAVVDQVSDLGGIRKLCQKASGLQFLVDFHILFHLFFS